MSGIIGKKIGMTNVYSASGEFIPCTIIEAGPCVVTQVKTKDKDGYEAIQLGYDEVKEKKVAKPLVGHFRRAGVRPVRKMAEFKNFDTKPNVGDIITVDVFSEGDYVDVVGTSKGRGYQGVVKRHGFGGVGSGTHGQHNRMRAPGSIGASSFPSKVVKGMRMAGHMGNARVKVINLMVVKVLKDKNVILLKGAVPGAKGSYVLIER